MFLCVKQNHPSKKKQNDLEVSDDDVPSGLSAAEGVEDLLHQSKVHCPSISSELS